MLKILKIFKRKEPKQEPKPEYLKEIIGISGTRYNLHFYKVENGFIRDRVTDRIVEIK